MVYVYVVCICVCVCVVCVCVYMCVCVCAVLCVCVCVCVGDDGVQRGSSEQHNREVEEMRQRLTQAEKEARKHGGWWVWEWRGRGVEL